MGMKDPERVFGSMTAEESEEFIVQSLKLAAQNVALNAIQTFLRDEELLDEFVEAQGGVERWA